MNLLKKHTDNLLLFLCHNSGFGNSYKKPNSNLIKMILLLMFINLIPVLSSDKIPVFYSNNKKTFLELTSINNINYINLSSFSKMLIPGSIFIKETSEISFKNYIIRAQAGSFFVLSSDGTKENIFQMPVPAINYNENIFVPFQCFLESINKLKIINAKFINGKIMVQNVNSVKSIISTAKKKNEEIVMNKNKVQAYSIRSTEKSKVVVNKTEPDTLTIVHSISKPAKFIEDNILNNRATFVNSIFSQSLTDEIEKANKVLFSNDSIQLVPMTKKVKTESSPFPPSVYVLPKDLIRRDIK